MRSEVLKGHLDMLLLAAVRDKPAHGYAIIQELARKSGGALDLPEGTIYPALHRLEAAGLIQSSWREESGRRRRVYELTRKGGKALRMQASEWGQFSRAVKAVLKPT